MSGYGRHQIRKGVKLVRGAYIEGERKLAMQNGVSSPVCQTKDETDQKLVFSQSNGNKNFIFQL